MIRFASLVFLVAACTAQVPAGQQPTAKPMDRPGSPNFIFDDDGGAVQVVPADLAPSATRTFHGGPVMKSVQQVSVFLGSGWGNASIRSRRAQLSDLLAGPAHASALQKFSIEALPAQPVVEDFGDLSKSPVNDLTIQRKLSEMMSSKAIPLPTAGTVYVVYLAPEIASTIGGPRAGVDYAAYHNFVNLDAGEVFYAVVPFNQNQQSHISAAGRALVEAALNPRGTGWY